MTDISDELRKVADEWDVTPLYALADRVDRELVELPKDAHGEYIRAGDTLDGYGKTIEVVEMRYGRGGWVLISRDGSGYADMFAFAHHHERPDSLERIANELEAWCDDEDVYGDVCEKPRDLVERIRKLAAKEQGDE